MAKVLSVLDQINSNRGVAVAVVTVLAASLHVSLTDAQANTLYVLFATLYVVYDLAKQVISHYAAQTTKPQVAPTA